MVITDLKVLLLETGLLQFGRFADAEGWKPYRLNLAMLPSYPDVFDEILERAAPLVGAVDHLVSTAPAQAFGTGLSLRTGIPLVYSRGSDAPPVDDLVGAYDIGHPALLLSNDSSEWLRAQQLIRQAGSVGLNVECLLMIVDEGIPLDLGVPAKALIHLPDVVDALTHAGRLPAGQARAVQDWVNRHHPG